MAHSRPDPPKCIETSNLMWLSLMSFFLVLFVCWNLFCTIANIRIKHVTETKNVSVLFYKNLKSSFLHESHIWLWSFFKLLDALAHGVPCHRRPASIPETKQKKSGDSLWGSGQLYSTRNRIVLRRVAERNDLVVDSMVSLIKRGLAKKKTQERGPLCFDEKNCA